MLRRTLPLALVLLPACLENEEEIEVFPDGSVEVRVSAKGDLADLAEGYAVPLHAPWRPEGRETHLWLAEIGPLAGGGARERLDAVVWPREEDGRPQGRLESRRRFASVAEWPRFTAPEDEPYRTAFLERSASLSIREPSERTVFVFERTYHARGQHRLGLWRHLEEVLPPDVAEAFDDERPLTDEQWSRTAPAIRGFQQDVAERFVDEAVLGIYVEGDASLPAELLAELRATVRARAGELASEERLRELYAWALAVGAEEIDDEPNHLQLFEERFRDVVRESVADVTARLEAPVRNAAQYALEWTFTAFDHSTDLGDEDFHVRVKLPGVLVGGNFDTDDDGWATWEFEGGDLRDRDLVLRAVSVLE